MRISCRSAAWAALGATGALLLIANVAGAATVKREPFGTLDNGVAIEAITLSVFSAR